MSMMRKLYRFFPGVKIMAIHHFAPQADALSDCVISQENFLSFIEGKRFVSAADALKNPTGFEGAYVLTVDDGLADLYELHQIAKKADIPLTAFISSRLVGQSGYITSEQLKEMADDPLFTVGSHGCTHKKLAECSDEIVKEEIISSKKELESLINKEISLFAYPNGAAGKREHACAKEAGYRYAFGVIPRKHTLITKLSAPYNLPRYNLTNDTFQTL